MPNLILEAYAEDDLNGTPLGVLTDLEDKMVVVEYNALGAIDLAISRHSDQDQWCRPDRYIRAYRDSTSNPPFAGFFITQSADEILGPEEDGIEVYRRQGFGALYYLSDATVWFTSVTSADSASPVPGTDVWRWTGPVHPAGILVRQLEEAQAQGWLPDLTYDFTRTTDSNGDPWTFTIEEEFDLTIGDGFLELVARLQALGLVVRMDHDFSLHAYESVANAYVGSDLSASVVFTKGVDIETSSQREQYAAAARSTMLVKGKRGDNGEITYVPVSSAAALAELKRPKVGFLDAGETTHFETLQALGLDAIYRNLRLRAGPTGIGVLDPNAGGKEALVDYTVGDTVTVDIPGIFNEAAKAITSITIKGTDTVDCDTVLGFDEDPEQAPAPPQLGTVPAGTPDTGCCPDDGPFVPIYDDDFEAASITLYKASGSDGDFGYPWLVNYLGTGDSPPGGFSSDPKVGAVDYYTGGGQYIGVEFTGSGSVDITWASGFSAAFGADVTATWRLLLNGAEISSAVQSHSGFSTWSPFQEIVETGVPVAAGDILTTTITVVGWADPPDFGGYPTPPGGYNGLHVEGALAVGGTLSNEPEVHQQVREFVVSDGSTLDLVTNYPYASGSVHVWVAGLLVQVTETDPTTGEFTVPGPIPAGALIEIHYQAESATSTGSDNSFTFPPIAADITRLPASETDTSLVLRPDGSGGVEWAAETVEEDAPTGFHQHVAEEIHLSDGSTTAYTLDGYYEPGSVMAWNRTTIARLLVTETGPDTVTVSAAGSSGDQIIFDYAVTLV